MNLNNITKAGQRVSVREELWALLEQADGYCELGMWAHAWKVLDDVKDEQSIVPDVLVRRLQILVGRQEWNKALILMNTFSTHLARSPDVWFHAIRVFIQINDLESAGTSLALMDAERRGRALAHPSLKCLRKWWP